MAPNPIIVPRKQHRRNDQAPGATPLGLATPLLYTAIVALLVIAAPWARRWTLSGAAVETLLLLFGAANGSRILPFITLPALLPTLNLVYALASTSWLLYYVFILFCYPAICLTAIFQFEPVANVARKTLRSVLKELQFIEDKVALFNLPALEIDTDVQGLLVVRGLTVSLSNLTIVAHGVEVGIKLSDDMELAMHADKVTVSLFRRIEINEIYGNLKGGKHEMTLGEISDNTEDVDDGSVGVKDTPLLNANSFGPDRLWRRPRPAQGLTSGTMMQDSSLQAGFRSVKKLSPDDERASKQYADALESIHASSAVSQAQRQVEKLGPEKGMETEYKPDYRAAVGAHLHTTPSVPHRPSRSVKVTTLQNFLPPYVRKFLHRLPLLLRLLLAPLSYFHPVAISAITAAGSGKWISHMINEVLFKHYGAESAEIRRLEHKVSRWLADANFVLEMTNIDGLGQVPINPEFDITTWLSFGDIMAYRTLTKACVQKQIVSLGGADATFTIPSFLLPHHEHLLPPKPSLRSIEKLSEEAEAADGKPQTLQMERKVEMSKNDESVVVMSVHASLPACFDQELLDFIAALVKATKVVGMEKEPDAMDEVISGFKDLAKNVHNATKHSVKKAMVNGVVKDKWIARLVGKIALKLEGAQGDLGYSGGIPVALEMYRPKGELPSKLLP